MLEAERRNIENYNNGLLKKPNSYDFRNKYDFSKYDIKNDNNDTI